MAAVIRVADMVAAHVEDCPVSTPGPDRGRRGLRPQRAGGADGPLRASPGQGRHAAGPAGPCPLSSRELDVLRRLAEGKVYKQIAAELDLSASTVRSHLHNVYGKLGALDRAQAVLMATEQGWI